MANEYSTESPLKAVAGAVGPRTTEAFSLLGNETRLAILLALWEAYHPFAEGTWEPTEGNAVPFSELRERVGTRDPGQFHYHLDKLEGRFVERTADGYQLLPLGHKLVRTVIASAGLDEPVVEPAELDLDCFLCGAPTAITYQNQRIYWVCSACDGRVSVGEKHPSGVLSSWRANPTILREEAPEAILTTILTIVSHTFALVAVGICPECSGPVDGRLEFCDDHDPGVDGPCPACGRPNEVVARFVCTVCKTSSRSTLTALSYTHPVVSAFAWKHDIALGYGNRSRETLRWIGTALANPDEELISSEPLRIQVTVRYEDEAVQVTYDETLNVVEIIESD